MLPFAGVSHGSCTSRCVVNSFVDDVRDKTCHDNCNGGDCSAFSICGMWSTMP